MQVSNFHENPRTYFLFAASSISHFIDKYFIDKFIA